MLLRNIVIPQGRVIYRKDNEHISSDIILSGIIILVILPTTDKDYEYGQYCLQVNYQLKCKSIIKLIKLNLRGTLW